MHTVIIPQYQVHVHVMYMHSACIMKTHITELLCLQLTFIHVHVADVNQPLINIQDIFLQRLPN